MSTHCSEIPAKLACELQAALAGDGAAAASIGDRYRDGPGPAMCEDARGSASPPLPGGDPRTAGAPHA